MNCVIYSGGNVPLFGTISNLFGLRLPRLNLSYGLLEWKIAQWYLTGTVVLLAIDIVFVASTFGMHLSKIMF